MGRDPPGLEDEARLRHVRVNCALLRKAAAGPTLLAALTPVLSARRRWRRHDVLLGTDRTQDELAQLIEAVGAEETFVVRLHAPPDTLAERIIAREPPSWSGLAGLVAHARAMADVPGADLVLSTEGEAAEAVAARIRETARL